MVAERCVVDTNVLVYSTIRGNPWHDESRNWLASLRNGERSLCITTQILREYLVVLTRGGVFEKRFAVQEALEETEALLEALEVLGEPKVVAEHLIELVRRYHVRGKKIHDANVVAVMLAHDVSLLATYNRSDFERFKEITLAPLPS